MKAWLLDLKAKALSLLKNYLASAVLKKLITQAITKALGISGLPALVLGYLIKKGLISTKKEVIKEEAETIHKKKEKPYEDVIKNPNSTAEQVDSAFDDLLKPR